MSAPVDTMHAHHINDHTNSHQHTAICEQQPVIAPSQSQLESQASADAQLKISPNPTLQERYLASFLLGACGDAMGYRDGDWEFNRHGSKIHRDMLRVTQGQGVHHLRICLPHFNLSDDTVMQIATAEGFLEDATQLPASVKPANAISSTPLSFHTRCTLIAQAYVRSFQDMAGRAPGATTMSSIYFLRRYGTNEWPLVPFNVRGGGCGAAMRATPLGLIFPLPSQINELVAYSIETGRMTHHTATGYLGALAAGLFTAFALQGVDEQSWGKRLLDTFPLVEQHLRIRGVATNENIKSIEHFKEVWTKYLQLRGIEDGVGPAKFPDNYDDVDARDAAYEKLSINGWPGATGIDAPLIAYDAYLSSKGDWEQMCLRGILHGGDNDSTGILVGSWYGARYGFHGVPANHYKYLEYADRMTQLANGLFDKYSEGKGHAHEGSIGRSESAPIEPPATSSSLKRKKDSAISDSDEESSSSDDERNESKEDQDEDEDNESKADETD